MKVISAFVAVLAVCQLQSSAAAGLRSNSMFLPNVGKLIDQVKDKLQKEGSLKDQIVQQYMNELQEKYEQLKESGEQISDTTKVRVLKPPSK